MHERFLASTAPIQIIGGGFGNGKTAACCIKAVKLIRDYPGCNGLIARATFPKLNDTIRKEFKLWCPPSYIKSFPESKNSDNTAKFTMGSQINFRYIAQQGKAMEQSTSNLLSATYDFAIIDQMEDPEITEKDFYDIMGRLRGNTIYRGHEIGQPKTGPRYLIMTVNPTGNWFYKRIIKPYKTYLATGRITDDLLVERDAETGAPIMVNGKPILMMELFEGSTYENKDNLGADFIKRLESTYRGQMKDRFLMGKWASYEGLVYSEWNDDVNTIAHIDMLELLNDLHGRYRWKGQWLEGYDYGQASPSCYLLAFIDLQGAVHIVDGFYKAEYKIKDQVKHIKEIRGTYGVDPSNEIWADPSIFKRRSATTGTVGVSTAGLFYDEDSSLHFVRGNNDIANGIAKVSGYINPQPGIRHPYTGDTVSPMLFVSDKLDFIGTEFTSYMWQKNPAGQNIDKPVDRDDHAMDTIKYMLSLRPDVGRVIIDLQKIPAWMQWQEYDTQTPASYARYGNK